MFHKPARLIERDGRSYVQMRVTSGNLWLAFQVEGKTIQPVYNAVTNENMYEFEVDDLDGWVNVEASVQAGPNVHHYTIPIKFGASPQSMIEVEQRSYAVWKETEGVASVADAYFQKPAKILQQGDQQYVELTITNANWWESFQVKRGDTFVNVDEVSFDAERNERVVRFPVSSLETPVEAFVHIVVKGIPGFNYDNTYTIRLDFN